MSELDISVVVPTYNEEKNVQLLYDSLKQVLDKLKRPYEIVFVNDGSTDKTLLILKKLHSQDSRVKIVTFRTNFGQTAAMDAGFKYAHGKIIVATDADLQNDPADIPRLIAKLEEGYDVVSGWRKNRKDSFGKHITSRIANLFRKTFLNDVVQDAGCTLKAYRKECFDKIDLFGEMHRFIPALLAWKGYRITEIPVKHHPRKFGKTKYGFMRVFRGLLDMVLVMLWQKYSTKPLHLFGGTGFIMMFLSVFGGLYSIYLKIFRFKDLSDNFVAIASLILMLLGFQLVITGFLADIIIKNYYSNGRTYYNIKEVTE